jgi:hypothetical protein
MYTFSYITEFREGTYCAQVEAENLDGSLQEWLTVIKEQKGEMKHLGDSTIEEIAEAIEMENYQPVALSGLKNIWYMHISTRQGSFDINIVKTDVS